MEYLQKIWAVLKDNQLFYVFLGFILERFVSDFTKPNIKIELGDQSNFSNPSLGEGKFCHVLVRNNKRFFLTRLLFKNPTANGAQSWISFLDFDTKSEVLKINGRWVTQKEPWDYIHNTVDLATALGVSRETIPVDEETNISIAIKFKEQSSFFAFNNESYLKGFKSGDNELTEKKYLLRIKISSEGAVWTKDFLLLNPNNQLPRFRIVQIENSIYGPVLSILSDLKMYNLLSTMKKEIVVPVVVAVIVAGGAGFFGGMKYSQSQRGNFRNGQFGNGGNFMMQGGGRTGGPNGAGGGRMMQGMRPVVGEIISSDDKSITVKMEDGSSKIVLISDSTMINKSDAGSKTDLKVGTKVGVFGADNNGTVTAQNIQINPQTRMMNSSPNPSPSPK